jgi:O-antigen/teichoic acid export membrane protein
MLKKRLARNLGANLFLQFTNVVLQLASVPLFLAFWSKERYGAWLIISAIPAYLALGEAGFATSSANEVSMAIAEGNRERALLCLHTAWKFLVGVSTALLSLSIFAVFVIPWKNWLKFSSISSTEARWTIFCLSLYSIAAVLIAIFDTIYRAAYRNARVVIINSAARLIEIAAVGVGLWLTSSMAVVASLMLAVRLFLFLVLYMDSRVFSPDLNLGFGGFSAAELKRSWRPSAMFMAATMGNALYFQGMTLLVGGSLGSAAVVVFNTTRTMTRVIVQFVVIIKHSVWPEFSYLFGVGDLSRARRLNELSFEVSWIASTVLATIIFFAAPWLMPLWTHNAVQDDPRLLVIFLTSAVLNGIWFVTSGFLMGVNQHEGLTVRYVLAATLTIILGALTVRPLGVYGPALAMIVCELMLLPFAISKTCQLLRQPVRDLLCGSMHLRALRQAATEYYRRSLAKAG